MQKLQTGILTSNSLTSIEEGRVILDLVGKIYTDIAPEKYGYHDPLNKTFDPSNIEKALSQWGDTFFWKRKCPLVEGGVYTGWGSHPLHGSITVDMNAKQADIPSMVKFVGEVSAHLKTDFAFIHLLTDQDINVGATNDTVFCLDPKQNKFYLTITTHHLVKYIPDLYWGTIFGTPYIEHFGRQRLLSSPAYLIQELSGDTIYLQLSASPFDLLNDSESVDAVKRQVKSHLGQNCFYDVNAPIGHVYDVPKFHLMSDSKHPIQENEFSSSNGQISFELEANSSPIVSAHIKSGRETETPQSVLLSFFKEMHLWELTCWERFNNHEKYGSDPYWLENAREQVRRIFTRFCTVKKRSNERYGSFRNPPEYDPMTETITQVEQQGDRVTIYTRQTTGFQHKCCYVLKKKERWRIDSKHLLLDDGRIIDAVL